jgi:hypothetical protein
MCSSLKAAIIKLTEGWMGKYSGTFFLKRANSSTING